MAKWLAALIILFPLSLQQLDYRSGFAHGLSLRLKKSAPAYAALEDIGEAYPNRSDHSQYSEVVRLAPGKNRLHAITSINSTQRLALRTLVIKQSFQARQPLQADMGLRTESPQTGLLPLDERKRMLVQYFRKQDWTAPSIQEKASQLVQADMAAASANADARIVVGEQTHTPIVVARPGADLSGRISGAPVAPSRIAANIAPTAPAQDMAVAANEPSIRADALVPILHDSKLIKGQLEIRDGLAFMGSETYFTLHRVSDGTVFESGRVLVSEASFEIYVKESRGRLIAELHSRDGRTLGRGGVDLDDQENAAQPKIELVPVATGAAVRVASGYSDGPNRIPVNNALVAFDQNGLAGRVADDGTATDPNRARRSTYVVTAQASQNWPTVALGVEGENQELRLYPDALVKSLLDLTTKGEARDAAGQSGVVWGRLLKNGKPVSGVEVELAGNYEPIYFNQLYLPDKTQTSTDQNGLFAFLSVRPGVQAIRIKYKNKDYPAQIFPSEDRHVSYVEIHLEAKRSVDVALQDAFDIKKKMSAHVRFIGVDDDVVIQDVQKLRYPAGPDAMLLEADAGPDYELSRAQVLKGDSHLELPLIRRDWLKSMINIKQITLLPERGTIVGLVTDQPFQVQITGYLPPETPQLIYFDELGQIAEGDSGPAGGGFVLFNAPLGLQTVQVKPLTSTQIFSQALVAEPEFVHVFKYSFGDTY